MRHAGEDYGKAVVTPVRGDAPAPRGPGRRGHRERQRTRPQISPAYAELQAPPSPVRRGMAGTPAQADRPVTSGRGLEVLGAPAVNVVQLNAALDRTHPVKGPDMYAWLQATSSSRSSSHCTYRSAIHGESPRRPAQARRARPVQGVRVDPDRERTGGTTCWPCCLQPDEHRGALRTVHAPGQAALVHRTRGDALAARPHSVSFTTNTSWRTTRASPPPVTSRGDGRPRRPGLRLGGRRHLPRARPHPGARRPGHRPTGGNFWVDLNRTIFRVILPLSIVFSGIILSPWASPRTWAARTPSPRSRRTADPARRSGRLLGAAETDVRRRRRCLQRQQRAPLREPVGVHNAIESC